MRRITSISLGSSARDKAVTATFAGQEFSVERVGTNGDMDLFRRKLVELDGKVDAFGLGGTDMYVYAAGRRYVFKEIERLASAAIITPVVDGSGLKNTLERETVARLQREGIVDFSQSKVLLVSAVDRFGMAEALDAAGASVVYGDLLFALGLPIPLRSLQTVAKAARALLPIVTRMPFKWLYPTGEKQNTITPKWGKYYAEADVIAGDFPYIRRYMPDDLKGKTILTNTITQDDVQQLRQRGVKTLITTTPELDGRSFGTNVMEGVLVAVSGRKPADLTPDDYLKLLAQLNWQPRVETLNPVIGLSPPYTITDLGVMSGFVSSRAVGVNDRGQVIGSLSREDWDLSPVGFLWTEGKMRDLGNVWLTSINNQGQIVGAKPPEVMRCSATLYNSGRFHALLKNTSAMSRATCINDCGQVVGYLQSVNRKMPIKPERRCFVWESGKRRYLDTLVGYQSGDAVCINNHGQIVGELWENGPNQNNAVMNARHAVLWDGTSVTIFDEPTGFTESSAVAINNQGQILVRASQSAFTGLFEDLSEREKERDWAEETIVQDLLSSYQQKIDALPKDAPAFHQQSFLWENGEMQAIDGLATALNDQGQVVGWSGCDLSAKAIAKGVEAPYAFLWQNGEMVDLNDLLPAESGWRLTRANGINNHGQIVGNGIHSGERRAFLLTPSG